MSEEQAIQADLTARFPFLQDHVRVQRDRRVFADVSADRLAEVFDHAVKAMRFSMLCAITGLDLGEDLGLIYHLARESGIVLNLCTRVPKTNPVVQTVTPYFPAAEAYEREVVDLLGFQVQGLPPGARYPLPNNWPAGQYPLRKDWKPESLNPEGGDSKEA